MLLPDRNRHYTPGRRLLYNDGDTSSSPRHGYKNRNELECDTITDPFNVLTTASRLFEKTPDTFKLCKGHRIGMLVYRTFDITHDDAQAPLHIDLEQVYGQTYQVCIYTGQVTEIATNGRTFCRNINAFEGCSGAIIFLLDRNQPSDDDMAAVVADEFHGRVVGINVGGLDMDNNLGFLINSN
jgi:hypothetical protein